MKTTTLVSLPYGHSLILTPDQTAVFVKLIQGAQIVKSGTYDSKTNRYKYTLTGLIPEMSLIPEESVVHEEQEEQEEQL